MNKRDINTIATPAALLRLESMIAERYAAIPAIARPTRVTLFKVSSNDRFYYSKTMEKWMAWILKQWPNTAKVKVNVNRGIYVDTSRIVVDIIGKQRMMSDGYFVPDKKKIKGEGDLSAVINGKSVDFEIKAGKDRQSDEQKEYQLKLQMAGGYYFIIKTLDEFFSTLDSL